MIQLTDEIRRAYAKAWYQAIGLDEQDVMQVVAEEVADPMPWRDEALKAVLAIVERDLCLKPRGHVFHPLARDLDREHAGMGLACTLCAGPCQIDDKDPR